ncbi:MAG: hypothetical protein LBE33_08600 [Zoogloeaceae bacterium]|jgi:hypothetical protein|nr:hypothetical protein [Zoogloeaceae bacterium]
MGTIEIILALLGFVGVGGIITNVQTKRKELAFKALESKERRYKSCLLYMDVYFNPKNIKYLSSRQSDIHSATDIIEYLQAEYHEMILYASKPVVLSVKAFIEHPSKDNFLASVLAMRQDLWTGQHDLTAKEIALVRSDA